MPEGIYYRVFDQKNNNLLSLYNKEDIKAFYLKGQDSLKPMRCRVSLAQDNAPYLVLQGGPLSLGKHTFYLQIKDLPVDTLSAELVELDSKHCQVWAYRNVTCNGKACEEDKSTLPYFYIIRKP